MRIVIITQDEPVFLSGNIAYLLARMPSHCSVVACVLFPPSPFGKKKGLIGKLFATQEIFGFSFLWHYAWLHLRARVRGQSLGRLCRNNGIPVLRVNGSINDADSLKLISDQHPDLLVSVAGNQIFRRELFGLAPKGCLNLHTALLPKYRGLMPSFWVLKNGEEETGVTVFQVDEGIDSGPILVQERMPIGDRSQYELIRDTKRMGMDALLKAFERIAAGNETWLPNDEAEMSYYSFPTRADVDVFRKKGKRFF